MKTETKITVRYAETDQMGIVHHSNYAVWFEAGRTDFLKKIGISNSNIESRGVMLPLYGMNCRFKSPARYEDDILVITEIKQLSRIRLIFAYKVINTADSKVLAEGETMHAWTDKSLKPINAEKAVPDIYSDIIDLMKHQL